MSQATVRDLMEQIGKLSDADRFLLEQHLADQAEAEWRREAAAAQELARERRIDQAVIDRAVEDLRYPPNGDGQ